MITGAKAAGAEILLAYPIPPEGPAIKQMKELTSAPNWSISPGLLKVPASAPPAPPITSIADRPSDKYQFWENDYTIAKFKEKTGKARSRGRERRAQDRFRCSD
jgi:hypothetical protein